MRSKDRIKPQTCSVSRVAAACKAEGSPAAAMLHRPSQASSVADCKRDNRLSICVTVARRLHGNDAEAPTANSGAELSAEDADWR